MNMNKWVVVLGLLLMPMLAWADDHNEDDRRLSVEKLWQMDRVGSPVISPAGGHVVVPVTAWEVESDESETRLWLLSTEGNAQRALTSAGQSASSPVFSPDGSTLAFITTRGDDEAGQIYLLSMDGPGEASRLTEVPTGVSAIKWIGEHIYFISSIWPGKSWDEMAEQIEADKDSHVSAMQWNALPYSSWDRYLEEDRQAHLYRVPAAGGEVEPLTSEWDVQLTRSGTGSGSFDVHPDETHLVVAVDSDPTAVDPKTELLLVDLAEEAITNLSADNPASEGSPAFSPNGETLA